MPGVAPSLKRFACQPHAVQHQDSATATKAGRAMTRQEGSLEPGSQFAAVLNTRANRLDQARSAGKAVLTACLPGVSYPNGAVPGTRQ